MAPVKILNNSSMMYKFEWGMNMGMYFVLLDLVGGCGFYYRVIGSMLGSGYCLCLASVYKKSIKCK